MDNEIRLGLDATDVASGVAQATKALEDLKKTAKEITTAFDRMQADVKGGVDKAQGSFATGANAIKNTIAGVASSFAALGIGLIAKSFIDASAQFENFSAQLTVLKGSSEAAAQSMDWIAKFAKTTPYNLAEVTAAFVKLESYGLNATSWMKTLGDTAAAMGKPIMSAVEAVADATTGEFERLKEFGIKAKNEGDQVSFRWTANGKEMVASSENTSTGIQDALKGIFSKFDGQMDVMANTWKGITSNLGDHWDAFKRRVMDGEDGLFEGAKEQAKNLLIALDELEKNGAMDTMADAVSNLVGIMLDGFPTAFEMILGGIEFVVNGFLSWTVIYHEIASFFDNMIGGMIAGFSSMIAAFKTGWAEFTTMVKSGYENTKAAFLAAGTPEMAGEFFAEAEIKAKKYEAQLERTKAGIAANATAAQVSATEYMNAAQAHSKASGSALDTIAQVQSAFGQAKGVVSQLAGAMKDGGKAAKDAGGENKSAAESIKAFGTEAGSAAAGAKGAAGAKKELAAASKATAEAAKGEREALSDITTAMSNYVTAMKDGTSATKDWVKEANEVIGDAEKLAEALEPEPVTEYERVMRDLQKQFEENQTVIDAFQDKLNESNGKVAEAQAAYDAAAKAVEEYKKKLALNTSGSIDDDTRAAKGLTAELKNSKDALDDATTARDNLVEIEKTGTLSQAANEQQTKNSTKAIKDKTEAIIADGRASSSFFEGLSAGFLDMQEDMTTMGEIGFQVFGNLRTAWNDSFFSVITGDFDELLDIWGGLLDSMLRMFSDFIAELILKWAMGGIADMLLGTGTGWGQGLGNAMNGMLGGGGNGVGSLVSGAGSIALSKYGPYASGYQTGGAAGAAGGAVSGLSAAGAGAGMAAGAYGLYGAGKDLASGNANMGTAVQAGLGAYSIYAGYPTVAAYLGGLGGAGAAAGAAGTAAAAYTGAGSLAYGATGSVVMNAMAASQMGTAAGTAIVAQTAATGTAAAAGGAAGGGAAGGAAAAGGLTAGMAATGFGAFAAGLYALQQAGKNSNYQTIQAPTTGIGVSMNIGKNFKEDDVRRHAGKLTDPDHYTGSGGNAGGDSPDSAFGALAKFDLKPIMKDAKGLLDILANQFGDGIAKLALQLDGTVASTDKMIDAAAGYDVSLSASAEMNRLAALAVGGSETAMGSLRQTLTDLGLSEADTETAMLGLIAATGASGASAEALKATLMSLGYSEAAATAAAASLTSGTGALTGAFGTANTAAGGFGGALSSIVSSAGSASGAVNGMIGSINSLSRTPLNIRVNVGVQERPYRIDNSNPYAEHADGGIFTKSTLLPSINGSGKHRVAEAGMAEAILPLPGGPGMMQDIYDAVVGGAGGGRPITVYLDKKVLFQAMVGDVDAHIVAKATRGKMTQRTKF